CPVDQRDDGVWGFLADVLGYHLRPEAIEPLEWVPKVSIRVASKQRTPDGAFHPTPQDGQLARVAHALPKRPDAVRAQRAAEGDAADHATLHERARGRVRVGAE